MGIILIWLIFGVCASVVASNRGGSAVWWFIIGTIFGPIGWAFAFTVGVKCPKCGVKVSEKARVCPTCKHRLITPDDPEWNAVVIPPIPQETKRCPFCAEAILVDAKKCRYCGEFLEKAIAEAK